MPKLTEVVQQLQTGGGLVLVGEWRGVQIEPRSWMDNKTGKTLDYIRVQHLVEVEGSTGVEAIPVIERQADTVRTVGDVKLVGLKRGVKVIVRVTSVESAKGQRTVTTVAGGVRALE